MNHHIHYYEDAYGNGDSYVEGGGEPNLKRCAGLGCPDNDCKLNPYATNLCADHLRQQYASDLQRAKENLATNLSEGDVWVWQQVVDSCLDGLHELDEFEGVTA